MVKERLSTTEQVINTIISGMEKETFKVGRRLPSQREMSRLFGVSRTTVREAMKILEGRGIVASRRGSGVFVNKLPEELLGAEDLRSAKAIETTMAEIMSFARSIWYGSLDQAIVHATEEELTQLHGLCYEFHRSFGNSTSLQETYIYETSFGMWICKASHNPLNYRVMLQLLKVTTDVDYMVVSDRTRYRKIISIDQHITEAMKERDKERALLWARERDREIQKIISAHPHLRDRKYRIGLNIFASIKEFQRR